MKKIFSYCKSYLRIYRWQLMLYVILAVMMSVGSLVSPYIVGDFMDYLLEAENMKFALRFFILFVSINVLTIIVGYVVGRLYVRLQNGLGYALNCDIIMKIQHSAYDFIVKQDAAYLNQRINNDANALIIFCINIIQNIIVNALIIAVSLVLLFSFHLALTLVLLGVASVYFLIYLLYKKALYRVNHIFKEAQSVFFSKLHEQLQNIRFIKLQSLYDQFIGRLNQSFSPLLASALKRQHTSYVFGSLDQVLLIVVQVILFLIGGAEIIAGRLSIGRFVIISSYFNMMLGAVRYFFSVGETVQTNLVSYNRLQSLSQTRQEVNGKQLLSQINSIELKDLSFRYGELTVINDLSVTFCKGTIYTVQGANGSGKSTLLDVLLGLHTGGFEGEVLYNAISIESIDMQDLRNRLIGIAEQEPTLLVDSMLYNIRLKDGGFSESELNSFNRLTDILHLNEFIQTLPNQLETPINENSNNISGGEKQKIAILRTLLKNPDVIILDEPTSALDEISRNSLIQYLNEIKENKIIIIVTHDKDGDFLESKTIKLD